MAASCKIHGVELRELPINYRKFIINTLSLEEILWKIRDNSRLIRVAKRSVYFCLFRVVCVREKLCDSASLRSKNIFRESFARRVTPLPITQV